MKSQKRFAAKLLALLISATLFGCGGGGSGSSDPTPRPDPESAVLEDFDDTGKDYADADFESFTDTIELSENIIETEFTLSNASKIKPGTKYGTITSLGNNTFKYSINPEYLETYVSKFNGSLLLNADNKITYPGLKIADDIDEIKYIDKNGTYKSVTVNFFTDPLAWAQWHNRNIAKTVWLPYGFEKNDNITAGVDLNVMPAWVQGYTGKNIVVAVIDEDMEIGHEDLSPNVIPGLSYNVVTGTSDPSFDSNDSSLNEHSHGTAVSGIIAASKNDLGGRGVAFDAKLVGYNYLHPTNLKKRIQNEKFFLDKIIALDTVHVVNQSYGAANGAYIAEPDETDVLQIETLAQRKVVIVRSQGNEYSGDSHPESIPKPDDECKNANRSSGTVDCFENFKNAYFASPFVITAGAMNAAGGHTKYGSTGSNLLLSAYGGDNPYIVTTDRTGCQIGYDQSLTSDNSVFDSCKYSSNMNGTSSAAPELSGLAALIKSVDPELSTLQTKYILIKSTQDRDLPKMYEDKIVSTTLGSHKVQNHDGWITNAAGYKFNNKFGFGVPDAAVAIDIAKNCSKDPECARRADIDVFSYADVDVENITSCTVVSEESGYNHYRCKFDLSSLVDEHIVDEGTVIQVEDVALIFKNITFKADSECSSDYSASSYVNSELACRYNALSNLQIELTSPKGTHSILKHLNSYARTIEENALLMTHAFYQETLDTSGTWTIDIISKNKIDLTAKPVSFGFRLYGFEF